MTRGGKARIVGAFEHPGRRMPDASVARIHADVVTGALADAGLDRGDVDGLFCDGLHGASPAALAEHLGLDGVTFVDGTNTGGSSYLVHLGHAAAAIASGRCRVALITHAGLAARGQTGPPAAGAPQEQFERVFGSTTVALYALAAQRHMHEFGTTGAQLAEVKVAASLHAQHNPNALLPRPVTVEQVLDSPLVSDPLHRLDCCITTDGGGAVVLASADVAGGLGPRAVTVLGHGEAVRHTRNGAVDLTSSAGVVSGARAFAEAGVAARDVDYASVYDSFTITVLLSLEDLGFCEKGMGGTFVQEGALLAPHGRLPVNTDGGGLCNNHPGRRGGMVKIIEAVRQLRGEAAEQVQVPDCELAVAHGTGGSLGTRHVGATTVLQRG